VAVILFSGELLAAPVDAEHAQAVASAYTTAGQGNALRAASAVAPRVTATRSLTGPGGSVIGYAVSLASGSVVVARADDDLPPVKLEVETGSYEDLPAGFRAVMEAELEGELADLAALRQAGVAPEARFHSAWQTLSASSTTTTLSVAQSQTTAAADTVLLTTTWNQDAPYNYYAPAASGGPGGRAYAGCGPCALAQILKYHRWPSAPLVDHSYTDTKGTCIGTHSLSGAGGLACYDWTNMPDSVSTSSSLARQVAVGRLVYHCGVAMDADFEADGTSVYSDPDAVWALRNVFGYACEGMLYRSDYATAVWYARVQADIDLGRPVYYAMQSLSGGHAVVCDGYRNSSEIHLNFGWSGAGNAWYNLDSVVFDGDTWSEHAAIFSIAPLEVAELATALDGVGLTWVTGGSAAWFGQTAIMHDGEDAAQSGVVSDSQQTWMQTSVTGPGVVSFWWKVSSEKDYDFLKFAIDGVDQAGSISGSVDWQQQSFTVGSGQHALKWAYAKDESNSVGSDAGWVDQVAWTVTRGVSSIGEVQKIGNDSAYPLNGSYWLTCDVDASATVAWNSGAGFAPIGKETAPFVGLFDGKGFLIRNLTVNRPAETNVGLFGVIGGEGCVSKLGLAGASVTGGNSVGGLSGANAGMLSYCFSVGEVTGGLLGSGVGVLVGVNSGTVSNCYATGRAEGCFDVGRLIGVNGAEGETVGWVEQCYATGSATAHGQEWASGLIDNNYGTASGLYWDMETGAGLGHPDGDGRTTAQMQQRATFAGWDFTNVWAIVEGAGYPYLRALSVFRLTFDSQGGSATPATNVTVGASYGTLPVPTRAGYTFEGWWTEVGGAGTQVTRATVVPTATDHTVFAKWAEIPNQPPLITKGSPVTSPAALNEGASVTFSVTASDSTDPQTTRGMSNVTWYVDGTLKQETKTGAPSAITSVYTLKTDANTVQGSASRGVKVTAIARDRLGGVTETNWTVLVSNVLASQTITFKVLPVTGLDTTNFNPGATVSSGLPITYASSNGSVAQIVDGLIHVTGAGAAVITASQPGNADYKAATPVKQTLTVKARLSAEVMPGGGTVTGAGLYAPGVKVALTAKPWADYTFLRWEDGSQTTARNLMMPNTNVTVAAFFGLTTNVPAPEIADPAAQRAMVGVAFSLPLGITSGSLPAVTVTGLPAGLSYSAAARAITGVPTAAVTNKQATVTAKNVNKVPTTKSIIMTVDPLPAWAQGAFNGAAGMGALGSGAASMSVTALGGVTGKLTLRGTNYSFDAKSFAYRDDEGAFWLTSTAKVSKVALPLALAVKVPESTDSSGTVPATLSRADGNLGESGWVTLYRNVWKDPGMVTVVTNRYAGYYTATLPGGGEHGSGYLTFTVDKAGGVKTAGKLADGAAVSLSGTLILDEAGTVWTVLYASPAAYKGGSLFGCAEFYKASGSSTLFVRPLGGAHFLWASLNPQATGDYGVGFNWELGLTGGWYDTVGNLYDYYRDEALKVGTDGNAPLPELGVGTNRYDSVWWNPNGIALAVATNKSGVMTGLSAPTAGTPAKVGGAYDYAGATNAVGLTVALTRATGVFKGSFKAWFDYAAAPTPKSVAFEGVLTPERGDASDGVAGRGYFLWADKGSYPNSLGKPVPYLFNWSYDFLLLSVPEGP